MLRANQAVRLGLRAASRNPELAFGKALLDLTGTVLTALPLLFAGALLLAAVGAAEPLAAVLRLGALSYSLRWPLASALLATLLCGWLLGLAFWSGALPLLAADAEMDARPPAGNFWLLAARGFPRVLRAGALSSALSLLVSLACLTALLAALPALAQRPSPALLAGLALVISAMVFCGILLDLLLRLWLVRAAALGDSASSAFARAASLLGARLGACLTVALAFLLLELLVGASAGLFTGVISSGDLLSPGHQILALGPRLAVGIASGVVFSWLEVSRQAALAALAADADGLLMLPPEEAPRMPAPKVLLRPRPALRPERTPEPVPEPVIEALPVPDEVIEALPAPEPVDEPEQK